MPHGPAMRPPGETPEETKPVRSRADPRISARRHASAEGLVLFSSSHLNTIAAKIRAKPGLGHRGCGPAPCLPRVRPYIVTQFAPLKLPVGQQDSCRYLAMEALLLHLRVSACDLRLSTNAEALFRNSNQWPGGAP